MRSLVLPAAFGVVVLALAAVVAVIVGWGGDVPEEVRPIVLDEPGDGESPGVEAEGRGGPTPDGAGSGEGDDRHEEGAIEGTADDESEAADGVDETGPFGDDDPAEDG
jgi:hypothetical protein